MSDSANQESAELPTTAGVVQTLVANHREFLGFLERRLGNRAVAEDILQDAFVRSMAKLDTLQSDESVVAWFYRILRNSLIDHHRRLGATNRGLTAFASELETRDEPAPDVHGAICRCVGELAQTLKPEYATILQRVEIDGVPVKDYATEAGISSNNAAVRIFRAREALKKRVATSCGTCAEHGCLDCTCSTSPGHCGA